MADGSGFRLADHDPGATSGVAGKAEGRARVAELTSRLDELQELFYADGRFKLLVVLQGMDTSGKGGAIRKAFEGLDPAGVHVASFKAPTEDELAHDFLWRVHRHTPCGTTTSGPTRTPSATPRPPMRPGSWCPPTASGTATW